jgi:hypothetical protein
MNPQIASALRWALVLAAGILVARGQLAQGQEATFADSAVQVVSGAAAIYALIWGQRDKRKTGDLLNSAMALPAGTPVRTLAAASGSDGGGWKDYLTRQAISTVLALVGDKVSRTKFAKYLLQLRDALNTAFPPAE